MKKTFIVANWKSNKTKYEAKNWFAGLKIKDLRLTSKEVIICPPFTLLPIVKSYILNNKLPIRLGAQDISPFDRGSYTGAINGKQIKEFAEFVIIGHSERRENFGENDKILFKKFELAQENGLDAIYCVQGKETKVPKNVKIIAYEPIEAIGTGSPDTPENANDIATFFKANFKVSHVLYGGSVTANNVGSFTQMSNIDGVLVGKGSLDVQEFYKIIKNA